MGKKIEERPTPKTDNAFVLFSENQNTLFQFHSVSVSPHLPPSMGSRKCSETVCTGFTTGSVMGTKGKVPPASHGRCNKTSNKALLKNTLPLKADHQVRFKHNSYIKTQFLSKNLTNTSLPCDKPLCCK